MMKPIKKNALAASSLALMLAMPGLADAAASVKPVSAQPETKVLSGISANPGSVPIRTAAETVGSLIEWDGTKRTITVSRDAATIVFTLGSNQALLNGQSVPIGQPVVSVGGRAYVPLAFLKDVFGGGIGWDDKSQRVTFEKNDYAGLGSSFVHKLFNGGAADLPPMMSEPLRQALPVPVLGLIAQNYPRIYGKPVKRVSAEIASNEVHTNARLIYETNVAPLAVTVRFDRSGMVDDLDFALLGPDIPHPKPAYDKGGYSERGVVLGEGEFALPGTLTVPQGGGPFPVVVLVQGSGPHDRDSSIGGAKMFRDLAAGLASEGIASLRYEKITKEHTFKVAAQPRFSLRQESADDVFRAVEALKSYKDIDVSRVYVAGHSQGGYAVPLMLEKDSGGSIAGAILLSAPSGQLVDAMVEQQQIVLERMEKLGVPEPIIAGQKQAAAMVDNVSQLVNDRHYSAENLPEQFPFQPAYWWYEQRDYVPAATAAKQSTPMLVLQGENDWQVSMKQFQGWKDALGSRSNVQYRSYPKVNHLLAEYGALSIGMEYYEPSNVSADIISDMADWIRKQK